MATVEELEQRVRDLEKKYSKVTTKEHAAEVIAEALSKVDSTVLVLDPEEHHGPLGGVSQQVVAFFRDDDRTSGVIINVYQDNKTDAQLREVLDELHRQRSLEAEIEDLVPSDGKRVRKSNRNW